MASLGAGEVARFFRPRSDLDCPVAVNVTAFVADDLTSLDLKDCAGQAFRCDRVVNSCHAFFNTKRSGTMRKREFFSLEGRSL
jgi:hypothetical protein